MLHAPDVQRVVAGGVSVEQIDDEVRDRAFEQRNTVARREADMQPLHRIARKVVA